MTTIQGGVERFGRFEIRGLLGQGGMGIVYRAFDPKRNGDVALKLLSDRVAGDPRFVERLRREAQAAINLGGPRIVPIYEVDEVDGRVYISMQLVDGRDLASIISADGPLDTYRVVNILTQIAQALDTAHRGGIIHRDIKPSSIFVVENQQDFAYLADFGIAHAVNNTVSMTSLTSTGAIIGTLAYIAPERIGGPCGSAQGNSLGYDGRADVYSLTCVLYEMLVGRPPFPTIEVSGLVAAHVSFPRPRVTERRYDVAPGWDVVIASGMAIDPDHRYPTARHLAEDVMRLARDQAPLGTGSPVNEGPRTRAPLTVAPSPPLHQRSNARWLALLGAGIAVGIAVTVGVGQAFTGGDGGDPSAAAPSSVTPPPSSTTSVPPTSSEGPPIATTTEAPLPRTYRPRYTPIKFTATSEFCTRSSPNYDLSMPKAGVDDILSDFNFYNCAYTDIQIATNNTDIAVLAPGSGPDPTTCQNALDTAQDVASTVKPLVDRVICFRKNQEGVDNSQVTDTISAIRVNSAEPSKMTFTAYSWKLS